MSTLETTTKTYHEALSLISRQTKRSDLKDNILATLIFDNFNTTVDKEGKKDDKFDKMEWRAFQNFVKLITKRERKAVKISKNKKISKEISGLENKIQESDKRMQELELKWQSITKKQSFNKLMELEERLLEKYSPPLVQINSDKKDEKSEKQGFKWKPDKLWNEPDEQKAGSINESFNLLKDIPNKKEAEEAVINGAIKVDISLLGRGQDIPEKENFEGIQKWAYITFPAEMLKEERDEFLNALSECLEDLKQQQKIQDEINKEVGNRNQLEADLDDIYTGSKTKVGTAEQQKKSLETYQNNPIRQKIKMLEEQHRNLWLKKNRTPAEEEKMNGLYKQIQMLYDTPYSGVYAPVMNNEYDKDGIKIGFEESLTTNDHDNTGSANQLTTNSHTGKFSWTKLGWKPWKIKLGLDFTKEEQYLKQNSPQEEVKPFQREFENHYEIKPSMYYGYQDLSLNVNSNISVLPTSLSQRSSVNLKYQDSSISVNTNTNVAKSKQENEFGTTEEVKQKSHDTTVTLSQSIGRTNISGCLNWNDNEQARIYSVSASTQIPLLSKKSLSAYLSPSVNGNYIDRFALSLQNNAWRTGGGINFCSGYNGEKGSVNLTLSDNYTGTFTQGNKPQTNNFAMANLELSKGKFGLETSYTNMYNSSSNQSMTSNDVNVAISYQSKIGRLKGGYTVSKSKNSSIEGDSGYTSGSFMFSWIMNPLDWFKKRGKH